MNIYRNKIFRRAFIQNIEMKKMLTFRRSTITDIAIIVCSLLFIQDLLPLAVLNVIRGVTIIFIVCFTFDFPLPFPSEKKDTKKQQPKQKRNHAVISKIMDITTTCLYIFLIIYVTFRAIDKSLFLDIITWLYWLIFTLYFILRIACFKLKIN